MSARSTGSTQSETQIRSACSRDAKIHAGRHQRSSFDLKARMCGLEALEDVVDGKGLRVHGRAAGAAGTGLW